MNKNQLIAVVAQRTGMSKAGAARAVEATLATIVKALGDKRDVRLLGFGTHSVAKRAAVQGRNPRTGEPMMIVAANRIRFKAGQGLRAALGPHGTGGGRGNLAGVMAAVTHGKGGKRGS